MNIPFKIVAGSDVPFKIVNRDDVPFAIRVDGARELAALVKIATDAVEQIEDFTKGDQGDPGRDSWEIADTVVFSREAGTLATGQSSFALPFSPLPNVSTVTLNGGLLEPGEDYDFSTDSLILAAPTTADNDSLVVSLIALPNTQDWRMLNIAQLGAARAKLNAGTATTIALYGTSITYGQDTVSGTTAAAINGATQTRSVQTFDANLTEALVLAGCSVSIANRGYPGDSSAQLLTRWAGAAPADLVNFECGHNDANNYGGNGLVSVSAFARNMETLIVREILKGAGVTVTLPPNIGVFAENNKLQPYREALRGVADKYGCPVFDLAECLQGLNAPWTDGIHLQSFAYAEWGWQQAALYLSAELRTIAEGDLFYADDMMTRGGALTSTPTLRPGRMLTLGAGDTLLVTARFLDNVRPVIRTYKATGSTTLTMYYSGGGSPTRGVGSAVMVHDSAFGARQSMVGTVLRRGVRFFAIRNDGASSIQIESISYDAAPVAMSRGALRKASGMTGVFQPRRLSDAQGVWWTYADWSARIYGPYTIVARLSLGDAGLQGIVIWNDPPAVSGEFVALSGMVVARDGAALKVYELVGLSPTTGVTAAGVFSAGDFTGEIEIEATADEVKVYVGGTLRATRPTPPLLGGSPGLISAKSASMVCHALYHDAEIKGPY